MATRHHVRRRALHDGRTAGERVADGVARTMGSWRFIIAQSAILLAWDPYPFILLNLALSFQAAYAAPIIMMSQNRQDAKDRKRDDLEADEVHELHAMNERQLEILEGQEGIEKRLARIEAALRKEAS